MILLVGGGTGTGKSTVATEVAYRLGITRVTSTDFVRQTMRAFFAKEFMPSIHYSSFEAGLGLSKAEEEESGDAALLGFLDQTRNVLTGVEAALQRALDEGWSMVLEGVHLVPGMITTELRGALVVQCVLAIRDEEIHRTHFWIRDATSDGVRPVDRYIAGLPEIRMIQEYVLERAARGDVPVIENESQSDAVAAVMELVLEQAERRRAGRAMSEASVRRTLPVRALRPRDRVGCARRRPLARPRRPGRGRGGRRGRDDRRARRAADLGDDRDRRPTTGTRSRPATSIGAGGEAFDLARRPARGPRRRRARRQRRDVDDRGRPARLAAAAAGHVHAPDGRRPARAGADRPDAARGRERRRDRRRVRAQRERHHRRSCSTGRATTI